MKRRLVWGLFVACSSCAVGPDYTAPQLAPGAGYLLSTEVAAPIAPHDALAADWWLQFDSPDLDRSIRQGLHDNENLASAQAALRASQAGLSAGYGAFFPQIDFAASGTRQRTSPFRVGAGSGAQLFNLLTLGLSINYAIDLFGEQRRTVEKLAAETDYQRAQRDAVYLTLTGNLVNAAIAEAAYKAQLEALQIIIAMQEREVALLDTQAAAGTVPSTAVLTGKAQWVSSQAALPAIRQRLRAATALRATLSGKSPAEWSTPTLDFDGLGTPPPPPLLLPSELVRRRPDIVAAEAALHAASAQVGINTAQLFPSVNLVAGGGSEAPNAPTLGTAASRYWTFGPTFDIPLFSGLSGVHQREQAQAAYAAALATYKQTVTNAFGEVGDAYAALRNDAASEDMQREALALAQRQAELATANLSAGLSDELTLLDTRILLQQARINLIQARALHLQDVTALSLALGRAWAKDQAP